MKIKLFILQEDTTTGNHVRIFTGRGQLTQARKKIILDGIEHIDRKASDHFGGADGCPEGCRACDAEIARLIDDHIRNGDIESAWKEWGDCFKAPDDYYWMSEQVITLPPRYTTRRK